MAWTETTDTRGGARDSTNVRQSSRTFTVWGVQPHQIISNPTSILSDGASGVPLPDVGSTHPDDSILTLDRYETTPSGNVVHVRAMYSNDGRFTFPPISQPTSATYDEWTIELLFETVDWPFAIPTRSTITVGSQTGIVKGWEPASQLIQETRIVVTRRLTIPRNLVGSAISAMATQNGNIHKIEGRYYLFNGGPSRPVSADLYEIQYSWTFDRGTKVIEIVGGSFVYGLPRSSQILGLPGLFIRPPYETLLPGYVTEEDQDGTPPGERPPMTFDSLLPYVYDENGWQSLPGM